MGKTVFWPIFFSSTSALLRYTRTPTKYKYEEAKRLCMIESHEALYELSLQTKYVSHGKFMIFTHHQNLDKICCQIQHQNTVLVEPLKTLPLAPQTTQTTPHYLFMCSINQLQRPTSTRGQ
jgi:hypothetical protein